MHSTKLKATQRLKALTNFLLIVGIALTGCAKERPDQITQAGKVNLLNISSFQGVEYDLETTGIVNENNPTSTANILSISKDAPQVNSFNQLSYKTASPHFNEVPFFGKMKAAYKLKYEITENHLVINKIGKTEDIPFTERTYSKDLGNGYMQVPMVGYPLTLYKLERVLNANNEETHNLNPVPVSTLAEATHFKMQVLKRQSFKSVNKTNVFQSDLLDGEWFYAATVVSASPELATSIGRDLSFDFKARSVSRIKFIKRSDSILGVNLNVDENIDREDEINLKKALRIPTEWLDYRRKKIGKQLALEEEVIDKDHEERKEFKLRPFMKLDFTKTESILEDGKSEAILDELELDKDYLSFVVYYPKNETKIRYSLRKAHKAKAGRIYYEDDRRSFGFFKTQKDIIRSHHRFEREEDLEKTVFMNRFIPDNGKIVYYFSKMTPLHMRESGRKSIKAWNKTFQEAGTGIEIILDESKDVSLGDIRFNIINIVDTKDGSRLLGYGPSIVDSESGEIISATSNIYANPFRESWISTIRNYIRSQLGLFKKNDIKTFNMNNTKIDDAEILGFIHAYNNSLELGPIDNLEQRLDWLKNLQKNSHDNAFYDYRKEDQINTQKNSFNEPLQLSEKSNKTRTLEAVLRAYQKTKREGSIKSSNHMAEGFGHHQSFAATSADAINKIESGCKDIIPAYISAIKQENQSREESNYVYHTEKELEVLNKCADRLLEDSVIATLVHELGHNFGLRHNFLASTDPENFTKDAEGNPLAQTSSIMDYQTHNVNELLAPGSYDTEAIRFGYAAKFKKADGSIGDIALNKSLSAQLKEQNIERKAYKFCTDEHVAITDPLCQRHDHGTNPEEIVDHITQSFYSSYSVSGNRYDRAFSAFRMIYDRRFGSSAERFGLTHLGRTFIPLKRIYDQWRFHLREFVGERDQYLDNFSTEEMVANLEKMKNDSGKHGKNFAKYYAASQKIYKFLKEIIFTPAKQCVAYSTENKQLISILDYEGVKESVFKEASSEITGCNDPLAIGYFAKRDLTYHKTIGGFYNDQRASLNISDLNYNKNNSIGLRVIRMLASTIMTARLPLMQHLQEEGFTPNFIDNPFFREEMTEEVYDRVLKGIDLDLEKLRAEIVKKTTSPEKAKAILEKPQVKEISEKNKKELLIFKTEKDFLIHLATLLPEAVIIPGKIELSLQRRLDFGVIKTDNPNAIPEVATVRTIHANTIIATVEGTSVAAPLIKKREELKALQASAQIPEIIIMPDSIIGQIETVLKNQNATISAQELNSEELTLGKLKEKIEHIATVVNAIEASLKEQEVAGHDPSFFQRVYSIEIALSTHIFPNLTEEDLAQPGKAYILKTLESNGIPAIAYEQMAVEKWGERISNYKAQMEEAKKQKADFERRRDNYEAQLDLITEILLGL